MHHTLMCAMIFNKEKLSTKYLKAIYPFVVYHLQAFGGIAFASQYLNKAQYTPPTPTTPLNCRVELEKIRLVLLHSF